MPIKLLRIEFRLPGVVAFYRQDRSDWRSDDPIRNRVGGGGVTRGKTEIHVLKTQVTGKVYHNLSRAIL